MKKDLQAFINEALLQPGDYVSYFVSQKLAEWYPEAAIIENESYSFNLHEFAAAGKCTIWPQEPVHCQIETSWSKQEQKFEREIQRGWLNILWTDAESGKEHFLDVVYLSWSEGGYSTDRRWIVAESQPIGENFLRAVCTYCEDVHGEILVYENGRWKKDEELFASIRAATFENLVLPVQMKQELRDEFQRFFAARELYQRHGIPWKRGVLLIGPPGNGKTHTIKALANDLKLPCLYVKSFKSGDDPEECGMRDVFARARLNAPCLVVMEDLDALVTAENRAFLLNEMDGFASNHGILVIASTNHPETLDAAILDRPSRFDRKYYFTLPAPPERLAYCQVWNETLQPELRLEVSELDALVNFTEGFSYAYLKELFLSGLMEWTVEQRPHTLGVLLLDRAKLVYAQSGSMPQRMAKASVAAAGFPRRQ